MKKLLIILYATCIVLPLWAQGKVQKIPTDAHPKIAALFRYADSLGFELYSERVVDERHTKNQVNIYISYYGGTPIPTEEEKRNPIFLKNDSIFKAKDIVPLLMLDSIRNTFTLLANEVQESYMKEYHKDGVDSILYVLTTDSPQKDIQELVTSTRYGVSYTLPNVSDFLFFNYLPTYKKYPDEEHVYKNHGQLSYFHQKTHEKDSTSHCTIEHLDKKGYEKQLKKIFGTKGFSRRTFYMRIDSTYHRKNEPGRWEMVGGGYSNGTGVIEATATIYQTQSKTLSDDAFQTLVNTTQQYLNEHPLLMSSFTFGAQSKPTKVFVSEKKIDDHLCQKYVALFHHYSDDDTYYFIFLDAKMDKFDTEYLPIDWRELKSWVNGKKVFYKKRRKRSSR